MSNVRIDSINSSANEIKFLLLFLFVAEVFVIITALGISDLQLLISNNIYSVPFSGLALTHFTSFFSLLYLSSYLITIYPHLFFIMANLSKKRKAR